MTSTLTTLLCALALGAPAPSQAAGRQSPDDGKQAPPASTNTPATTQPTEEGDAAFKPAQPDFTLVGLPTALRLPKYKSAFRVTHRFLRALDQGDFGDLAASFFGIDAGAQIGLEYRFGVIRGGQVGFHRTSDQTIEFFAAYDALRPGRLPFDVTAIASIEGVNNFHASSNGANDSYSPSLGAVISKLFGEHAAVYVEPIWVNNTNSYPKQVVDHNDTFIVGLGTRIRVRPSVYIVLEASPRAAGYREGVTQGSFAIEKRKGGHVFQLNFSNGFGTTVAQIARGGPQRNNWYMGFNISRKFY